MSSMDSFATTLSTSTVHILDGSLIYNFLVMSATSLGSLRMIFCELECLDT